MIALVEKYIHLFSGATSVTVLGTAHGLQTADLVVQLHTDGTPRQVLGEVQATIHPTTFDVVVTFGQVQSGRIILVG